MIYTNPTRTEKLICTLTALWEASVRDSHLFLTNEDINKLIPFVKIELGKISTLMIAKKNDIITGFLGIEEDKIEMLFIDPKYVGKGIGKKLISEALDRHKVAYVDVNEQNHKAVDFYEHIGFIVYERTELDEQGNPFPILKMKLK